MNFQKSLEKSKKNNKFKDPLQEQYFGRDQSKLIHLENNSLEDITSTLIISESIGRMRNLSTLSLATFLRAS